MTVDLACPCEELEHPALLFNPPGRSSLAYRAGDFDTFRRALLAARAGELELKSWRPTAAGDLALQMVEWWAYVADILTFYNEQLVNEAYLDTARRPESVARLIRLLGYRPRPGIGAQGVIAALSSSPRAFTLPAGFQVQSKPGPGKQPQVFELGAETIVNPIDAVAADLPPSPALLSGTSALLKGTVSGLKSGDRLLLLPRTWATTRTGEALVTVQSIQQESDPRGKQNTRVTFATTGGLPAGAAATDYRLLRSNQSGGVWTYPTGTMDVILANSAHMASLLRQVQPGDPVLFEGTAPLTAQVVCVDSSEEVVWYANPGDPNDPAVSPDPATQPPIPLPHTLLTFGPALVGAWDDTRTSVKVSFAWTDAGELIPFPARTATLSGPSATLTAAAEQLFPIGDQTVLVAGAAGDGLQATAAVGAASPSEMSVSDLPTPAQALESPLQVLFNLLQVSRGQTVSNEVLGGGDAIQQGQEFVLKKSPLTYLLSADAAAEQSYASTLHVWVGGTEWHEVPSFYEQPPDARVFITREDDDAKTHVIFGDGVNGARLPSGAGNVVATYRYGSGAEAPESGALSVILKPYPGLKSLRNPVPAGGGADPDPPERIRLLAPRSVLSFGRAISADDYEVIAAQTPGVARARSYWSWDHVQQRTLVTVYVGDDSGAVAAAGTALANAIDPNRPVQVLRAAIVRIALAFELHVQDDRLPQDVIDAVTFALVDAGTGLFGVDATRIGRRIYDSEIYEACLTVPGAVAVHALQFTRVTSGISPVETTPWHDPGTGAFFQLDPADLSITFKAVAGVP